MDHTVLGMMHHGPFENIGMYEPPKPRFVFKMPRVVPDQKAKFESDELFRRLSRESEVRYTGHRDRPIDERVKRFVSACQEGHTEIAFSATGTNLQLVFNPPSNGYMSTDNQCDFEKEQGKVNIKSSFIMNGVCVRWRGYVDLERLDGVGAIEFDEESAMREDAVLRDQMERYTQRLRDYEDNKPRYRLDRPDQDEVRHAHAAGPSAAAMSMQRPYMKLY